MEIPKVLDAINIRTDILCENLENFCNAIEEVSCPSPETDKKLDDTVSLREQFDDLMTKLTNIPKQVHNRLGKGKKDLTALKQELEENKRIESDLEESVEKARTHLLKLKAENERLEREMPAKKDLVKACKLVTGTHFNYEKHISGFLVGKRTDNYEIFEFEEGTSQNTITKNLWELVEKVN